MDGDFEDGAEPPSGDQHCQQLVKDDIRLRGATAARVCRTTCGVVARVVSLLGLP